MRHLGAILRGTGHSRFARIKRRMIPVAKLRRGQSPWDDLPKEDLIFLLWSYHSVAHSAHSALVGNTWPGQRSGNCEDAIVEVAAAINSVHPGYSGPTRDSDLLGGRTVPGMARDYAEHFWRTVMRPVAGCLAFDVPDWLWWACRGSESLTGGKGEQPPDCPCRNHQNLEGKQPCGQYLFTWDDWRAVAKLPVEEEAA